MNMTLRNETENDFRVVEEITREAFWNLYVPGCNEHYLAHILRDHADFVKELDFVAEIDDQVVGNIMYTKAWLVGASGNEMEILSFGPVSILPAFQRQGIGSALIQHTIHIAKENGVKAIVILGDPHNYCKHGFKSAKDLGISNTEGEYPFGMLALELQKGALAGQQWQFKYSDAYLIDDAAAEKFDQQFAPKEKAYQPSQDVYGIEFRAFVH